MTTPIGARIIRSSEAPAYHPPLHNNVRAKRLQGHEASPTERFWVGESLYPAGASADESPTAEETVYVVLDGALDLKVDGSTSTLMVGDSVHMPKGTTRSVINSSDADARLLVIIANPPTP